MRMGYGLILTKARKSMSPSSSARISRLSYVVMFAALCSYSVIAQDADSDCSKPVEYVNRNQVDPTRISLRGIEGRAIDSDGVAVPDVCVALFSEKERKLVAQTVTDENGYFRFGKISEGDYRLVGRLEYDHLCPVNVRIRQRKPSAGPGKKKLILHMRPSGIDDCSYGDTK